MQKIVLASASPRRAELLKQVGFAYDICIPEVDELIDPDRVPSSNAVELAKQKARCAAFNRDSGIVLAADTLVVSRGLVLGKPKSRDDAFRMLKSLSGTSHSVITGLCLIDIKKRREVCDFAETLVWMKNLTSAEIESYVASEEPMDKAGAYGIQGKAAVFIERIEGCYYNVVGLPLSLLDDMLKTL